MKSIKWCAIGFGGGFVIGSFGTYIGAPIWLCIAGGAVWGTWCGIRAVTEWVDGVY